MARFNNGIVFTNDNCISCNKCIANCSVIGANVCSIENNKRIISVNSNKCNHCGQCVINCSHNARVFRDDCDEFFADLKKGEKISVILDQSFYVLYGDSVPNIIAYLRAVGVDKIYDSAYGAEICFWGHVKYLSEVQEIGAKDRAFIINTCSSFVNNVELYYPGLLRKIVPVQSPAICTAIYAHKYLGDTNKIAFLGSCIAKKDEILNENTFGNINYNLTFEHFTDKIDSVTLPQTGSVSDLTTDGLGNVLSSEDNFGTFLKKFFPPAQRVDYHHGFTKEVFKQLDFLLWDDMNSHLPLAVQVYACSRNCKIGPGYLKRNIEHSYIYSSFDKIYRKSMAMFESDVLDYKHNREVLNNKFQHLNFDDFKREFQNRYKQQPSVPKTAIDEIFSVMLKDTPEKQNLNCGSCGYKTCREMAEAIAYGYNKRENCVNFKNDILERNYYYDSLTGLYNREGFIRHANAIFASPENESYAVYIGNINRLKVFNDIFSFEKGSEIIKYIASTLKNIIGDNGIVSHFGNGFFAILVKYKLEIVQAMRNTKFFDCSHLDVELPVTIRFGVYVTEGFTEDIIEMINNATLCMDNQISSAANTYTFFTKEFQDRMVKEVEITAAMPLALADNEFKIWFQPQIKTGTEELVGAETLCRWIKPDGEVISPSVFIPVAEKNGFIRTLDKFIWRSAFEAMARWIKNGYTPVPISINISRVSLESDSLIYTIKRLDDEFKIPHELIHFEITESSCMDDTKALIERINKIKEIGFEIAMDDFGSGYSSLNSLKDIPIDILKLDMGFFSNNSNMEKGGSVISSVLHMAQSLELITVAEGVETASQSDFLTSLGCDVIQGFLYAKPMCEDDFVKLLKNDTNRFTITKPRVFGQLNVNNFYNPDSSENLMFEKFTGPAAIIEFNNLDYRGKLLRANRKCMDLFNAHDIQVSDVASNIRSYINPDSRPVILETMNKVVESGQDQVCVTENFDLKIKTPIWVKMHFSVLNKTGNKHILYCLMEDVTDEKISENTLSLANNQMSLIMDNSSVGLLLFHINVDLKRPYESVKLRVLRVNKQFCEISGYEEEEVLKWTEKDSFGVIHPLDRPAIMAKMLHAFMTKYKNSFSAVYRARNKDGSYNKVRIVINGVQQDKKSYFLITNFIILENNLKNQELSED